MAKLNEDKILIIKGVQEFRSSGVQEFRSSGVQEFRSSGVQEFRSSGGKPYGFFYPEIHEYIF
jgi:hypothetical protein